MKKEYIEYSTDCYKINKIDYNRNGIGGEGFYSVDFTFVPKEGEYTDPKLTFKMIGIINDDDLEKEDGYTRFYVVTPKNIFMNWRGDNIGYAIIPGLKKWHKDWIDGKKFKK